MFKVLKMRYIASVVMLVLANIIILVHAVVPHHHHDCRGADGFVFENELTCSCDESECGECHETDCHEHHRHTHHPFGNCKLHDLLSKLVLNTKDEKFLSASLQLPVFDFSNAGFQQIKMSVPETEVFVSKAVPANERIPDGTHCLSCALRAPPAALPIPYFKTI